MEKTDALEAYTVSLLSILINISYYNAVQTSRLLQEGGRD